MRTLLLKDIAEEVSRYILKTQLEFKLNSRSNGFNLSQTVLRIVKEHEKMKEDGESKKD